MGTSVGSILMTLTGSGGGDAVLAETSFLQPASVPSPKINNAPTKTGIAEFRAQNPLRCVYTIMLALRNGEVVMNSIGACDTASASNSGTCHFDETETEWIQKSDGFNGIQSKKSLIRMQVHRYRHTDPRSQAFRLLSM